jgi:hypothetical protein
MLQCEPLAATGAPCMEGAVQQVGGAQEAGERGGVARLGRAYACSRCLAQAL